MTLAAALTVPLLLTGCSGSSDGATPAPSSSPTTSAVPFDKLPVATSYVVTAGKDVSDKELRAALDKVLKIEGLRGAALIGGRQLRVDLAFTGDPAQRKAVLDVLHPLGTIRVP